MKPGDNFGSTLSVRKLIMDARVKPAHDKSILCGASINKTAG
jgi:hypothetical protein